MSNPLRCLSAFLISINALPSTAQDCSQLKRDVFGSTEWMAPSFDRSRNLSFSKLYIASFGDSLNLVDPKLKRSIAEHMLIVGKNEEAARLLKQIMHVDFNKSETVALLASAYQRMGYLDSALAVAVPYGQSSDWNSKYGQRFVQTRILKAQMAAQQSPNWVLHNKVLDLPPLRISLDSIDQKRNILENAIHFEWELSRQVHIVPTPNLILARTFEEVADAMSQLSWHRAEILYYIGMQYDPDNSLGIKARFEENHNRMKACGARIIFNDEDLGSAFPPPREVTKIDYEYHDDMLRVLAYQDKVRTRSRVRWIVMVALALGIAGFWFARLRYLRRLRR
ncbi:hypothetical protein WBG78_30010 [Chryseolinea sp. T2]|uniref:hypothetical protein n=1 Tax=Chryseolinea sp. T2 TaxID=3129255 RepID=UPI0030785020